MSQKVSKLLPVNDKQHALAAEIRAEMAARRITATEMQKRTDIKHASWRNWFVTCARPVPYPELEKVSAALGVPLSELLVRADQRATTAPAPTDVVEAALSDMSPEAQAAVREARRHMGHNPEPEADPGRAANG